ncbi:MAG: helix-turn-helix domain-containing protein [Microcoleaceae cyanobacterium]
MKEGSSSANQQRSASASTDQSSSTQVQRLMEIGQQLAYAREHHSLSIDLVAAYTNIRPHLLQALEQGKLEQLPEGIYTQGLIRRYGDALGLDGRELADYFSPEPIQHFAQSRKRSFNLPQLRPTHLYLTYILLIIFAVNGLAYLIRTPGDSQGGPERQVATQNLEPQNSVTATPEPSTQTTTATVTTTAPNSLPGSAAKNAVQPTVTLSPQQSSAQAVQVGVNVKDESWVLIEVDGKTEFQGILPGGTQKTWEAREELVIVAGNAGGVIITVNDGEARRLGEPGAVEEAVFKAISDSETDQESNS